MALPNKPLGELKAVKDPEVDEREVDVLIVGGGMAACGAAFEVKKWMDEGQSVLLVDKAAMERSGAVAQGLSAINTFIGENSPDDYVRMVRNDLMGIVREDLIGSPIEEDLKMWRHSGLGRRIVEGDHDGALNGLALADRTLEAVRVVLDSANGR